MNPRISIIIPCYNSGNYLPEALASVETYRDKNLYEIIIIDDGSTDKHTITLLHQLENAGKNHVIIRQENKGPAAARNQGVKVSRGEFLLFLDSDNKIRPEYIDTGIEILDKLPETGVVYGNAHFFGAAPAARFTPRPFLIYTLLLGNYIDVCSVIRRTVWDSVNGFDEERIMIGHEDWEFWIRVGHKGWKFYHVQQTLYDYRIGSESLLMQVTSKNHLLQVKSYVYRKNADILAENYEALMETYKTYHLDKKYPVRTFGKHLYQKYLFHNDGEPKMQWLYNTIKKLAKNVKK